MQTWIKQNLLKDNGHFNSSRMTSNWFIKNGFEIEYNQILKVDSNLKKACQIILGFQRKCETCNNLVIQPKRFCSVSCSMLNPKTKEKRTQTCIEKYGVKHHTQSQLVQNKKIQTNLKRYGVEQSLQSKEILEKFKQTNLKKLGVEFPTQSEAVMEKQRQTFLNKYGVNHNFKAKEVKEQIKQTCLMRYGVEHHMKNDTVKEQFKQNVFNKYGVFNISQLDSTKQKIKNTCFDKYGVQHHMQSKNILEKQKQTNIKKYGVENVFNVPEIKQKILDTNFKKYGSIYPTQNDEIKQKTKNTCFDKYGVYHYGQSHYSKELIKELEKGLPFVSSIHDSIFNGLSEKTKYNLIKQYRPDIRITSNNISQAEKELTSFIKENTKYEIILNSRDYLDGQEIDIYIPELKLGFEYNGTYWHSTLYKEKDYHQKKSILARDKGIRLIHIWEFNGIEINKEIVLSHLNNTYTPILIEKDGMFYSDLDRGSYSKNNEIIIDDPIYIKNDVVVYGSGYERIK